MLNRPDNNERQRQIAEWKKTCGNIDAVTERSIIELSERNFDRLKKIIENLQRMGKLDTQTLDTALERVSRHIPKVPESKKSKSSLGHGSLHSLDNSTTFFMKKGASRNQDSNGGQSIVSIGYTSAEAKEPGVSVKRLSLPNDQYTASKESFAIRETKNHRLLGRRAQWYTNKKGKVIVADWQHGTALDELSDPMNITTENFSKYSPARRFTWLVSGLTELNILHKNFRLHGDIKPGNFILDLDHDKMKLIDFGATQKVNSPKDFVTTPMFIDMIEGKPKKLSSDMFGMGFVLCWLFPDLLDLGMKGEQRLVFQNGVMMIGMHVEPPYMTRKSKTDNLTPVENAVYALFDALMETTAEDRCTSEQALQFCTEISALLQKSDKFSAAELQAILNRTINRNTYTVEDALRNSMRPAKFGAVAEARPAAVQAQAPKKSSDKQPSLPTMYPRKKPAADHANKKEEQRKKTGCTLM